MDFELGYDLEEAFTKRPKISLKGIEALRLAISDIKTVPGTMTDKQLALFLDASDGKVETARKVIETYYECRKHAPEHFSYRDPCSEDIKQCLENQDFVLLPPKDGYPIIFHQLSNTKASNYMLDNAIKAYFMSIDICLHQQGPKDGVIFLFDMRNVRLAHLTRVRISTVRKFFHYVQEGLPAKLHQIHILNCVSFFDKILSLIKPFMKAEIFKVLYTYPPTYDMNEFYKNIIPKECLPNDFGGDLASVDELNEQFKNEYFKLKNYFRAEEQQRGIFWDEVKKKKLSQFTTRTMSDDTIQAFKKLEID